MTVCGFDLEQGPALLARTPSVLDVLLRDLPPAWQTCDEGPDSFSPHAVLGHLAYGEETDWIPRARQILESGEARPFEPFDRFGMTRRFQGLSTEQLLDRFALLRGENLQTLRGWRLAPEQLARTGLHPDFGRVTLGQLLATWVVHDLGHIGQVVRVMSKRHVEAVGPWRPYVPVLNR